MLWTLERRFLADHGREAGHRYMRRHVARKIWSCKGNVLAMARVYGVKQRTMMRWIAKLNLRKYVETTRALRAPGVALKVWWEDRDALLARINATRIEHGLAPVNPRKKRVSRADNKK